MIIFDLLLSVEGSAALLSPLARKGAGVRNRFTSVPRASPPCFPSLCYARIASGSRVRTPYGWAAAAHTAAGADVDTRPSRPAAGAGGPDGAGAPQYAALPPHVQALHGPGTLSGQPRPTDEAGQSGPPHFQAVDCRDGGMRRLSDPASFHPALPSADGPDPDRLPAGAWHPCLRSTGWVLRQSSVHRFVVG